MASASWSNGILIPLRRPLITCLLALGVGAMTAGCGGSEQSAAPTSLDSAAVARVANASPKPSTPASTRSSAPTDRFAVPEAAKAHTHDGAVAFVKFYWETTDALDRRPETGIVPKLSSPTCRSCVREEANLRDLAAKQAHVTTANATTGTMRVREDSTDDTVVVTFLASDEGIRHVGPDGKTLRTFPGGRNRLEFRTDWDGSSWKITEAGRVAAG